LIISYEYWANYRVKFSPESVFGMLYNRSMRLRKSFSISLLLLIFLGQFLQSTHVRAQSMDPASAVWIVLDSLNGYRLANGLSPLQVNSNLMAAAQSQADYLASTYDIQSGADGHVGSGGSRPIDRAYAFGYGGGKEIDVSENWAGLGITGTSPEEVVYNPWWADSAHQNTMLDGWGVNYTDVGIGVANQGTVYYYVIDVGAVTSDKPYVSPSGTGNGNNPYGDGTQLVFSPIETAAPAADGSVTHIVKEGQNLLEIALSYGVKIDDIRQLNGMAEGWVLIYPDEELIIKAKGSTTPSADQATVVAGEPTPTATLAPTYTPRPKSTQTQPATATPRLIPSATATPEPANPTQMVGFIIIGICGVGLVGFLGFSFKKSNQ
jgi:uncharacterized protein YkwD/LysM repeat protein